MPVKVHIAEPGVTYFITFTCFNGLALIQKINSYDLVYKWFNHLKDKGHLIVGYVIMPNHIHVVIAFKDIGQSINTIIGNGKRFMAYEIVGRLKSLGEFNLLKSMALGVSPKDNARNKKHSVWKYSFDWKECIGDAFIEQKINYMHQNPCKGKWHLASTPEEYEHSSAKFYICGEAGVYPVTNYLELNDIDI